MATDKTRYKDVKVRIPEEELAVLNCRVAKTGMSREQYIRCLIADTIPAEYPPADYRLIIRKLDELQETMDALVEENPIKRDAIKLYITLQNVASTADMLRRAVMPTTLNHSK
ncbi:ribbon-helix-helix protein, CopG family [Gemmiger formicilis]|uniref:ribbon-helix-helix protein, CopG family n=1 Tax=Gemmiger formicilis TaxID=745368 RepID=UPI0039F462E0